jgi:hypothetical protein
MRTVAHGLSVRKEKKRVAKKRYTAPMYGDMCPPFGNEKKRKETSEEKKRKEKKEAKGKKEKSETRTSEPAPSEVVANYTDTRIS